MAKAAGSCSIYSRSSARKLTAGKALCLSEIEWKRKKTWEDHRAVLKPWKGCFGEEGEDLLCAAPRMDLGSEGGCESKENVLQVPLSKDKVVLAPHQ